MAGGWPRACGGWWSARGHRRGDEGSPRAGAGTRPGGPRGTAGRRPRSGRRRWGGGGGRRHARQDHHDGDGHGGAGGGRAKSYGTRRRPCRSVGRERATRRERAVRGRGGRVRPGVPLARAHGRRGEQRRGRPPRVLRRQRGRAGAGLRRLRGAGAPGDRGGGRRWGDAGRRRTDDAGVARGTRDGCGRAHREPRAGRARFGGADRVAGRCGRALGAAGSGAAQPAKRGGGACRGTGAGSRSRALHHGARTLYRCGAAVRARGRGAGRDDRGRLRASPHGGAGDAGGGAPDVSAPARGGGVSTASVFAHRAARRSARPGARERRRRGGGADLRRARAAASGHHRGSGGARGGARRSGHGGGARPRGAGRLGGGAGAAGGRGVHARGGGRDPRRARAAAAAGGRGERGERGERGATAVSRRRTWARRGASVITGMAVGVAVWFGAPALLQRLAVFRVRQIELVGVKNLAPDVVIAALRLPSDASVFTDTRLLDDRLRGLAGVAEARVVRQLPAALKIELREVEPAALAPNGRRLVVVDAQGRTLPFDPARTGLDLPVAAAPDRGVVGVLALAQAVDPALFLTITSARGLARGDVLLELGPRHVLLGRDAGPEVIRAVELVARDLAAKGRPYVELDARFARQVIVRRTASRGSRGTGGA